MSDVSPFCFVMRQNYHKYSKVCKHPIKNDMEYNFIIDILFIFAYNISSNNYRNNV